MSKGRDPSFYFLRNGVVSKATLMTSAAARVPALTTLRPGNGNNQAHKRKMLQGDAEAKKIYQYMRKLDLQLI